MTFYASGETFNPTHSLITMQSRKFQQEIYNI